MNHPPGASSRPPPAAPARAMNHLSASRRITGPDRRSRLTTVPPLPPAAAAAAAMATVPGPSSRTRAPSRSATYAPPPPPPATAVPAASTRRMPVPAAPALNTARPVYHLSLDADKLPPGELDAIAGKITRRGGDVEPFFSKNVTHLVVDDALKPLVVKVAAAPAASLNSMRHRILKSALDLNAKIVTYSELRAQLYGNASSATSSSKDASRRTKSALRPLTGHYFVVLDSTGVHRPIMEKEYSPGFTAFPKVTVMPDSSQTPFLPPSRSTTTSGDAATLDALLMDDTDPDTPCGIIGLVPAPSTRFSVRSLPASAPPLPPVLAARARIAADPNVKLQKELDFLHDVDALLASRAPLSPGSRAPLAPLGGAAHAGDRAAYCERCDGKFRGLDDHVRSDQHRKVVRRTEYWRRLDDLAARHARVKVPDGHVVRVAPLPRALHEAISAVESDVPPTSDDVVPPSEDVYGEDAEEEGPIDDVLAEEGDVDVNVDDVDVPGDHETISTLPSLLVLVPATATAPTPFATGPPAAIAPLTSFTSQFSFDMDSRPATMAPGGHSFKSPVLSTDVRGIKSDAMPSTMPLSTMPLDPSSPCVQAASHRRARQQQQLALMRKQGVVGGNGGGGKQLFHTPVDSGPGSEDVSELSDLLTSPTPKRARLLTPNS
ncbi:hypothetical protein AMAG_04175 [Allomyces macrogynus ATCC 38327]|uniref:DBF4-type domain-containing protein n=1 Tax=Allomyces macrogynus (strain ATCC 38327) TaxID=578462 RepID=A0A0L0S858_ALLM3|nr:hypothetical protein AMAG_04175 [Allomyces macrogynus ATCC 38327]|eukprot:KNE58611.1 hypothetical protein AMAG_04175 [Allomyces macrogynus ATCC 38327]